MDDAEGSDDLEGLGSGEMLSMIKFGADRIFKAAEGAAPSDEDLEAILDRSTAIGKSGAPAYHAGKVDNGLCI